MKPLNAWPFRCDKKFSLSLFILLISACASTPEGFTISKPLWQINGKIAYQQTGKQSGSASFNWIESEKRSVIHAFGPLGQNLFSLQISPNNATYQQADGKQLSATNAETLLQQAGNFSFPVKHLSFWLQGKAQGDENQIQYNAQQQISALNSGAWQVSFSYKGEKTVPHKIQLHNNDTRLTLINKHYERF